MTKVALYVLIWEDLQDIPRECKMENCIENALKNVRLTNSRIISYKSENESVTAMIRGFPSFTSFSH